LDFGNERLLSLPGEQGATRQAITQAQIEVFRIKFPVLEEQQTIVRQLDAIQSESQKLEAIFQKKIDDLEELKKSILQKAFAEELTAEKSRRDDMVIEGEMIIPEG
jgi:type I restriction enzyme S subunit